MLMVRVHFSSFIPGLFLGLIAPAPTCAQFGPNSPANAANVAAIGSNAWSSTSSILSSDNNDATLPAKGLSNYLVGTDHEFNLMGPANVVGIQLDIERHTQGVNDVALLDNWTTGLSKTVSAGTNRCLVVIYSQENGTTRQDITSMTYGGRPMTPVTELVIGGGGVFSGTLEVWIMLNADLALASGTAIVPTYASTTQIEFCEAFTAAVFQHVDQLLPVSDTHSSGAQASTNPQQLGAPLTTLDGSMAVNAVASGNNTTPATTNGGTNTYTINSGYMEGTDLYYANTAVAPTSGVCFQVACKSIGTGGFEQPTCTFNGSVNRWLMIGFTLQRARELDNEVRLIKGGVVGGSNLASTAAWSTSDAVMSYGGPTELWGRTWTIADINAPDFGAALSTLVQNGTAHVDHFQITVFLEFTLPIELVYFRAVQEGHIVRLDWATATEVNNDHFLVQRSVDGATFEDVSRVQGAGNSLSTLYYSSRDEHAPAGMNYYRLKQVDIDGTEKHSAVVPVKVASSELSAFPNPSPDGSFTLLDVVLGRDQVSIYDQDMHFIRSHVGAGSNPSIHLGDLVDGVYVIVVRTGEHVRTTRLVKNSIPE